MRQREWKERRSWRDAGGDELTVEGDIGRAVRVVAQPAVPDGEDLAALRRKILSRLEPGAPWGVGRGFLPARVAVAGRELRGAGERGHGHRRRITFLHYERRPAGGSDGRAAEPGE